MTSLADLNLKKMNSCIQRNCAFDTIEPKCSNKRITCLDNKRYRFCFRTSKSVIEYGNIKYCPKSTTCCEDTGTSPCIKQDNNETNVTFQMITPDYEITKATETTLKNQSSTAVNITPFIQQYETFITTPTQAEALLTTKSTTEQNTKLTTKPTTERILQIKHKKKPNKTKNKAQKSKRKTLLTKVKMYLNKLQKKINKKKKHKKTKNSSTPNYIQAVQQVSTSDINLFTKQHINVRKKPVRKLPTKHPLRKVTQKIKKKAATKPFPTKSTNSKLNKIKLHRHQISLYTRTNDILLPVTEHLPEEDGWNNLYTTNTIKVVNKVTDKSKVKIIKNKPVKTSSIKDNLDLSNHIFTSVTDSSTISTITDSPSTSLYIQTSSPWIFTNFKMPSTTRSTVPPQLSACSMPTKFRGAKCNEYYECVKIMWTNRLMLFRCKSRESFDPETLNCIPNTNCY
ncbi:unnamed protein product [Diabrotica balteata]|uniref:Chitin-binding type-2 domain-containing protein n=1 Tax=Diabrotica balteata TaxID=107213 RepID=A0A9N9XF95_DIABA|nr:unnamed protein product [Diabrotica balteata]